MVFYNSSHPRRRLLMLLILFLLQVLVKGWTFPRRSVELTLPEDYPLNTPFYRISILLSERDILKNVTADLAMKVVPFRKMQMRASSINKKEQYVRLDKSTGILTFVKILPNSGTIGRRRHRLYTNITITGFSKNDRQHRKCDIQIEFLGTMDNYCSPGLHVCFPSKKAVYSVPEDSMIEQNLDFLMNPALLAVCPNISVQYNTIQDDKIVAVNSTSGVIRLISELDAEEMIFSIFRVTCTVGKKDFIMVGNISLVDVNDNPPTTHKGESMKRIIEHVKPNVRDYKFQIQATDRDSKDVNNLITTIEDDPMNLFRANPLTEYETIGQPKTTLYSVDIIADDLFKFNFTEYNFTVVIEDRALQKKERKVIFPVTIIRESYDIELQNVYEVNISRTATDYARILQISPIPLSNYRFRLSEWRKDKDWLRITERSGIVFIQNALLMSNKSTERRNILWWKTNGTEEIPGISKLIININEGFQDVCRETDWCPYHNSKKECISNCGKGSIIGFCSWRDEPLTVTNPTNLYSACSADFKTCPDNHCDELEQMDSKICPLDCAKHIYGSVFRTLKTGIGTARGICSCNVPTRCRCFSPPEEMILLRDTDRHNRSTVTIEVKNISVIDAGKRFGEDEETTTDIDVIPIAGLLKENYCGIACVVLASMAPCGILILCITIFTVRRIRSNRMSHLKVGGSRISLSAVPSDYVQERPNSVQDTRTTTSDSSSAGKTILDPKWEFPRNRLQFQTILGEGEFGKVVKAQASNINGIKGLTTVAVKMLKENGGHEEMQDLITEFTLLKDISHPNVIKLLGACTEKGGPFYLIVEYAEMGSLRSYLRKRRKHNNCCKYNATYGIEDVNAPPPREYYQFLCERSRYEPRHCFFHKEQLSFAWQIAKGMAYLAEMKLVHRDLAARNILLDKKKVAKISDFGLSRDVYKGEAYLKKTKGRVPVKWLALESLEDQIYTTKSDVWSFGVVLWEIMMQGATPYPGVTPQRLFNLLKAGYRMSKPEYCPDEVYLIMRQCWRKAPHERPSFKELVHRLEALLLDTVEYMDFETKTAQVGSRGAERPILSIGDPSSSIQYTTVLIDNEEEFSDVDSLENIGLVNLFNEAEKETHKTSDDRESST